ncbi:MAG: protein kinase domain-containing protein, partial [Gemmatimonadaceae bacterium]
MTDIRAQLQQTLGSTYTLERELGGGGMSRVFVAEENALHRKVVVKVLPPELTAGVNVDRFNREILLAAQLQHAHIVPVLAAGETNGLPYYTMPFVDGESLRNKLTQQGPLSITDAISILRDVARALAYAHARGIVHRDIKPENVLLSGGSAVVTDFGIAKAISASRLQAPNATLTQVGTSIGTPAYMAPEQAAGDPATDHRADLYAFGCVAYELLAGRPPFVGKTPQKLLAAQMSEAPQSILALRPDTPVELADVIMRCLAKDPDDRPQAATEVVRVLDTVTSGGGHTAMPPILLGGKNAMWRALGIYAVAFIAVGILAKAAIVGIGLPDWIFPGAMIVMALGLPVILFTAYVQRATRRMITMTPTFTPGGTPATHGTMATFAMKASPHMSWRRTALGGTYALAGFVVLIGAFMLMRALGIGPFGSLLAAGQLDAKQPLLVAEFAAKGGADSALGGAVAEAVRADLGQSNAITVMPVSALHDALQRMQLPLDSRIDASLARQIAQRVGSKAVITGDITPLGNGFLVTERIVAAQSGNELASFQGTANSPSDLIPTVGKLTRNVRGKIGESLKSVQNSPALADVTTGSLDALKAYTEGLRRFNSADFAGSIAPLKQAVAFDSAFAEAWRKLGTAYYDIGALSDLSDLALTKAYRYRDH